MTPHPQPKEYICNDDDLGCLHDYMMAAMAGDDISELPRLWNQEIGVIKSRPHTTAAPAATGFIRESFLTLHSRQLFTAPEVCDMIEQHRADAATAASKAEREQAKKMYSLMMCVKKENTDEFMEYYESRMHEFEESLRGGGAQ